MLAYLREPYPLRRTLRSDLLFIVGSGIFVAAFLIIFQPGDTYSESDPNKHLFLAGYGVITIVILLLMRFVLPRLLPRLFRESGWTVGKHLLWLLASFLLVIVCSFFYLNTYFGYPFYWDSFFYFLSIAGAIGVFPLTAFVILDYIRQLRLHLAGAKKTNQNRNTAVEPVRDLIVTFPDEQGETQLECPAGDVLYLAAAMNYVEVFYRVGEHTERLLIRNTLKNMEQTLPRPPFMRTHRSYLVNIDQVLEVTGNAQGYQLHLRACAEPVPVSRSRSHDVLSHLTD